MTTVAAKNKRIDRLERENEQLNSKVTQLTLSVNKNAGLWDKAQEEIRFLKGVISFLTRGDK